MKLRRTTEVSGFQSIMHWCPACDQAHGIRIKGPTGPLWLFNGNYNRPTFTPSILCFTTYDEDNNPLPEGQRRTLCHYFITDGKIQYCADSPHEFAGRSVDIPEWPYANGAYGGIEE